MSTVEMIVLANSRKHSGRCVAGIRTDGQGWLRPVGQRDDKILTPKYYTLADGTEAGILDVIRLQLVGERAEPHHPENWRVRSASWELVSRPANPAHFDLLSAHVASGPALLGNTLNRVPYAEFLARPAAASLALVAPQTVSWCIKANGYERKIRVGFTLAGAHYDLALTDPKWEARLLNLPEGTHGRNAPGLRDDALLFTVSLSEPFQSDETAERCCYKLVAAVIVVSQPAPGRYALAASSAFAPSVVPAARPTPAPAKIDLSAIDLSAYDDDPFADPPDSKAQANSPADAALPDHAVVPEPESETLESHIARQKRDHVRAYEKWTDTEDARLAGLAVEGRTPKQISAALQRNLGAIHSRLNKLGVVTPRADQPLKVSAPPATQAVVAAPLPTPVMINAGLLPNPSPSGKKVRNKIEVENDSFEESEAYARHGERWSDEEDNRLIELLRGGWSAGEIALELQRKVGAIHARVVKLIFAGVVTLARRSPDGNDNEGNG